MAPPKWSRFCGDLGVRHDDDWDHCPECKAINPLAAVDDVSSDDTSTNDTTNAYERAPDAYERASNANERVHPSSSSSTGKPPPSAGFNAFASIADEAEGHRQKGMKRAHNRLITYDALGKPVSNKPLTNTTANRVNAKKNEDPTSPRRASKATPQPTVPPPPPSIDCIIEVYYQWAKCDRAGFIAYEAPRRAKSVKDSWREADFNQKGKSLLNYLCGRSRDSGVQYPHLIPDFFAYSFVDEFNEGNYEPVEISTDAVEEPGLHDKLRPFQVVKMKGSKDKYRFLIAVTLMKRCYQEQYEKAHRMVSVGDSDDSLPDIADLIPGRSAPATAPATASTPVKVPLTRRPRPAAMEMGILSTPPPATPPPPAYQPTIDLTTPVRVKLEAGARELAEATAEETVEPAEGTAGGTANETADETAEPASPVLPVQKKARRALQPVGPLHMNLRHRS
ncbi:hypothetical protein LTR95_015146 [Oleoguttula sp. CCFEE 5521]